MYADQMLPVELERQLIAGLARTDVTPSSVADERRQAEFFGWLAVRTIVPRALRRAGYEALAQKCENESELGSGRSSAMARLSIGHVSNPSKAFPRVQVAYGS